MQGEEIFDMIELELNQMEYDFPTSIEIPNESYKNFWNYIDRKKINGSEFGNFKVCGIELYVIPVNECFKIVEKDEKKTKKELPYKFIFEGEQGQLKTKENEDF